ncbi:MAG: ABC transporter ATP-binding protein [Candidatus Alectryocaccobium sp.]|jgi:ATP-binding cassette subfamily B multidrug efflux pump|nr:ABC transporter ATP-binding protein/permease [Lachnospiraceae bacterium]MDY6221665.1 ABC transporter ATP-binding protein [Candidatus Alectryocaccobium sp.]
MIKTLAGYIKEYKLPAIITPLMMVLEVIFDMLIPLLMASLIDDGVNAGDMSKIIQTGIWMLLAAMAALAAGIIGAKTSAKASAGFAKNLREGMFSNIQKFSFSNIDRFSTASLVTRLTTDTTNIQMAFQMLIRMAARAPLSLIIAMIMTFIINARLAMIYLIAVIILGVILLIIMKKGTSFFEKIFPKYDELNAGIQENVTAIRVVKSFVREDDETAKLKKASQNIYRLFSKAEKILCFNMPVMMFAVYACLILVSWFGAKMIVVGDLTTGDLMSLLSYCMNILISLMMLSMVFVMISMSAASAERICEVLDERSDLQNPKDPVYEVKDGSVEFDNVSFSYHKTSEKPILQNINIKIPSGSVIGIMGGTGAGKTSLVNLISRLYDVTEGSVKVGGLDVRDYDMETLRDNVAVVLQKNVLFSGTILENLHWGNENATLQECVEAAKVACAHDFIINRPEGYDTYIEQGGSNVSGGQKQRICIARALLKKPKILILDDSTSAVDTATDARINDALRLEAPDMTKIIIAQRISSIQHADMIIVMDDGMINGIGTHEELLNSNEIYSEVYASQQGGNGDFDEQQGGDD